MKLDFNRFTDTSRFTLALLLSTTTALLVAAPFIVMFSSGEADEIDPASPTSSVESVPPAPSLGIDEAEVGRIGEAQPRSPGRIQPQTTAPAVDTSVPETTVDAPTSEPATTIPEQTTVAPETSATPDSSVSP